MILSDVILAADAGPAALTRGEKIDNVAALDLGLSAAEAFKTGIRAVHLGKSVQLSGGEDDLEFWFLNRELSSWGVRLHYEVSGTILPREVAHLQPPSNEGPDNMYREWRQRHHYLMLSERRGGSFRSVIDRRNGVEHFTISDVELITLADTMIVPRQLSRLESAKAEPFLSAQLMITVKSSSLWLPIRFRRPPVPAFCLS